MEQKMDLTLKGYLLSLINVFLTLHGFPILGIIFGSVAVLFFVKALRIKNGND